MVKIDIDPFWGLKGINGSLWLIKSGNNVYIYSGMQASHAKNAKDVIAGLPENAGRPTKIHKVV